MWFGACLILLAVDIIHGTQVVGEVCHFGFGSSLFYSKEIWLSIYYNLPHHGYSWSYKIHPSEQSFQTKVISCDFQNLPMFVS